VSEVVVAHCSDIHFGGRADLNQLAALESYLPAVAPRAIVLSGDLTLRARHGEFQAAQRYLAALGRIAPVLVVPGNHDVQWWRSPLGVLGREVLFRKYRHYFGADLTPVLELDDVIVAGMLSAHGVALGSCTWNLNDLAVKGHLPAAEVARVRDRFEQTRRDKVRLAALHHNVLPGVISHRWGLARPHSAQHALLSLGADVILCGHDHTEGAGQIDGRLAVSTAGTHSVRTRGGRPSAFNVLRIDDSAIEIVHHVYQAGDHTFRPGASTTFARERRAAAAVAG